jgi:hypothetical protein
VETLTLNGYSIVTAAVAAGDKGQNITLTPNGAGTVVISGNSTGGAGQIKLNCDTNESRYHSSKVLLTQQLLPTHSFFLSQWERPDRY